MFIETHKNDEIELTFLKSANVQVFPCGRRRSSLISADTNGASKMAEGGEGYYIPFDPEAKLNTEANNRKHSGLNGYTQTYVKSFENNIFSFVLAGYLFNINLDSNYNTENTFGAELVKAIVRNIVEAEYAENKFNSPDEKEERRLALTNGCNYIYANIRLEDLQLFTGFQEYITSILRDQTGDGIPSVYLDICNAADDSDYNNYYFSGLSFSTVPLTSIATGHTGAKTREQLPYTITRDGNSINQQLVSLCILEKVDRVDAEGNIIYEVDDEGNPTATPQKEWKIYQPALLPEIRHDATVNSLVLGDTRIEATADNPGNLDVANNATIRADLTVAGDTTITGSTVINTDLTINQGAESDCGLTVNGNAVVTGNLNVANNNSESVITAGTFTQNGNPVPILDVVEGEDGYWQLQFSCVSVIPKS